MKIGIVTWFKGCNYGTNLQAIALQYYLRKMGHDVKIINYQVQLDEIDLPSHSIFEKINEKPEFVIMKAAKKIYKNMINARNYVIEKEVVKNCIFTEEIFSDEQLVESFNSFDLIICGSDQIWNPYWYHKFYYADYNGVISRKISYAPSIGVTKIPDDKAKMMWESLQKFESISVREKQAQNAFMTCFNIKPELVLDPTFLVDKQEWKNIFSGEDNDGHNKDYVLSMFLSDNRKHWKAVKKFVKKHNLENVVVPYCGVSYFQDGYIEADAGLGKLINLINNAQYIITDSFHITVFSIIFQKQFYTFKRFNDKKNNSQNSRVVDLLDMFELKDRLIANNSKEIYEREIIDYSRNNVIIQNEIQKSKKYLLESIDRKGKNIEWKR